MKENNFLGAVRVFAKIKYPARRACKVCVFREKPDACMKVECREISMLHFKPTLLNYVWINKKERTI